jgi:hypothetical protein
VNEKYELDESIHPFAFCGLSCVFRVNDRARVCGIPQDEVLIVFEAGTVGWDFPTKWVKKIIGRNLIPLDKDKCVPLQAADLIAYEHQLGHRDMFEKKKQSFTCAAELRKCRIAATS